MLTDLTADLRYALGEVEVRGKVPYWEYVDIVLDFANLGFDQAALANYVLFKTQLPTSRTTISWDEVDAALSEMETP